MGLEPTKGISSSPRATDYKHKLAVLLFFSSPFRNSPFQNGTNKADPPQPCGLLHSLLGFVQRESTGQRPNASIQSRVHALQIHPYMPAVCLFVLTTVFKPFIVTKLLQISVSVALSGWWLLTPGKPKNWGWDRACREPAWREQRRWAEMPTRWGVQWAFSSFLPYWHFTY